MCLSNDSHICDTWNKEDRFEWRRRPSYRRHRNVDHRRPVLWNPLYHQLKSWRFQDDMVGVTICLHETKHCGVEIRNTIEVFRKEYCACS
jgi:hypothetical protein